jgi:toxin FitB
MFLLDTNVISELRKANTPRINPSVARWAAEANPSTMFLSAIVIEELEVGVRRIERRDPSFGRILRNWLELDVLPSFHQRILPVDTAAALAAAKFHVPVNRPFADSLIAATALLHGLTVVTRDIVEYEPFGIPMINPWNG